jgi:hypothetical protein
MTLENLEAALAILGAMSVVAALVAKLTPNTKDDTVVAKIKKVLDFLSLSLRERNQ